MNRKTRGVMALGLLLAVGLVTGCEPDANIEALKSQNEQLMVKNKTLEDQVSELQAFNGELRKDNEAKEQTIISKQQEIVNLQNQLAQKPTDVIKVVEPAPSNTEMVWISGPQGAKTSVGSDVLFNSGKATLTSAGQNAIGKIARDLQSAYSGLPVRVYGFTDSDPIKKSKWKDNLDLSSNRAMAVTRYLISKGVDEDRIETIGMGATHFIAPNNSSANKAKNRRVEIFVVK